MTFRLSESEQKSLNNRSKQVKMSVSEYCRISALNKEITMVDGLGELVYELHKIGGNVNQIAYAFNSRQIENADLKFIRYNLENVLETVISKLDGGVIAGNFETSEGDQW